MDAAEIMENIWGGQSLFTQGCDYVLDSIQRSILFMDVMRERGNRYLEHNDKGLPPVLVFGYEIIVDGRTLDRPANYALARIIDKRKNNLEVPTGKEKRKSPELKAGSELPERRPIVIIDPRAGHGPGIGGSKNDSEIGLALSKGHPVYFVMFFQYPERRQVLADVKNAEIVFLEEVRKRHPKAPKPVVIGNCQGGWAAALVGAERPDLVGPLLLNGSPLSYWSGVGGKNPMRYRGGLIGGVWFNSLLGDMGNGLFDGANLVLNMELLNPANTFWSKQYNLYAKVDTEAERFLNFERWWGGFYMMTTDEIHTIVDGLFVGNRLVRGNFELEEGKSIDLKRFNDPVVVFASEGDNITPPQQALNWIPKVYSSVDEIKRHRQIIVYIVHPEIGHLGIFVATSIAKKEQKKIIGSVEMIEFLSPGLYEMIIVENPSKPWMNDYKVKFEEREIEDIMAYDDGDEDEEPFKHVAVISELNDKFYQAFFRPFVRTFATRHSADVMRQLHPLRTQRYMVSDLNPMLVPVKTAAPYIRENRHSVKEGNVFTEIEKMGSKFIEDSLDLYRNIRDMAQEQMFIGIYKNPMLKLFFPDAMDLKNTPEKLRKEKRSHNKVVKQDREALISSIEEGGYTEGVVRLMIAMAGADGRIEDAEYKVATRIVKAQKRLRNIGMDQLKNITRDQARILQTDYDKAIDALPLLIRTKKDRDRAMDFAQDIAFADEMIDDREKALLERLQALFYK
jgi:pimeloyl-ACP methyl ester carboxylesterase/tellurite resistance protein